MQRSPPGFQPMTATAFSRARILSSPCLPALMSKYHPFIKKELDRTGYPYSSVDEIPIESKFMGPEYSRALTFMIFDHVRYPFSRGAISCSKTGFFLEKEFFLGLPKDTDPSFLFKILGDEKLTGNPPTLDIQESKLYPEWNSYFHIRLHSGTGFEFGIYTLHSAALGNVEAAIRDSVEMYEHSMIDGFSTIEEVEEFMEIAYRCFEAY